MARADAAHDVPGVALLRGVNLAGKNRLAMKHLAEIFIGAGCRDVVTYIQSGNVVFRAEPGVLEGLAGAVTRQIAERFGLRVPVILRTAAQLGDTIRHNPFLNGGAEEANLHVYFLADLPAQKSVAALDPDRSPPDAFSVRNREVYLHLPNGMGRSKLTNAYFDSKLGTVATARNWRTVLKLFEMTQTR